LSPEDLFRRCPPVTPFPSVPTLGLNLCAFASLREIFFCLLLAVRLICRGFEPVAIKDRSGFLAA
jgi:hypothetical protein